MLSSANFRQLNNIFAYYYEIIIKRKIIYI